MTPTIAILMITHNRLEYTRKAVGQLSRISIPFKLVIVDNASSDQTCQYLETIKNAFAQIQIKSLNVHKALSEIANEFWHEHSHYDLVGKVDNDTLVSPSWMQRLIDLHQSSDQLAAVGGFPFNVYVDWNFETSKRNIRRLSNNMILVQSIIGGCAYLLKSSVVKDVGFLDSWTMSRDISGRMKAKRTEQGLVVSKTEIPKEGVIYGWQEWQGRAENKGYINGYVFPLEVVDHMDDPLSCNCLLDKDDTITALAKKNAERRGMEYSRENISKWIRGDGEVLFTKYVYKGPVGERVYD